MRRPLLASLVATAVLSLSPLALAQDAAEAPAPDAAAPAPDAAAPAPDAAAPAPDAESPAPDAESPAPDAEPSDAATPAPETADAVADGSNPKGERPRRSADYKPEVSFGGPDSPERRTNSDDSPAASLIELDVFNTAMEPWYDFKKMLNEDFAVQINLNYVALYQSATATVPGAEDKAAAHGLRGNLIWTVMRGTGHSGNLNASFEAPHSLGTDVLPDALGPTVGSSVLTSNTYGDSRGYVANVYWHQRFLDNKIQLALGRMDPGIFWGGHPLAGPGTDFMNTNSGTNGAIAYPGIGFGGVAAVAPTDNFYVMAGIHDASAINTRAGFETLGRGDVFAAMQVGFVPSIEERFAKQIHLLGWYSEKRNHDGVPESWGLAATAYWTFEDIFMPFARAAWSEGGAAALGTNLAVGIGIKTDENDQFGVSVGWAKPIDYSEHSSFHVETYWRIHLFPNVALTPSAQIIIDPPNNPDKEAIGVFGWRLRFDI